MVMARFKIPFATAHNGLIELALGAGIPALLSFLVAIGALLVSPFSWLGRARFPVHRAAAAVAVGICGYFVTVNSLETFIGANLLPWALFVMVCTIAARSLTRGEPPSATAPADTAEGADATNSAPRDEPI
jgi:O-antigen ligase